MLNEAAFSLRALGRFRDAAEPMREGAKANIRLNDWKSIATSYGNLSELHLSIGDISAAIGTARRSVDYADRSGDAFQRMARRATLADVFHTMGEVTEATRLFEEAERLQTEGQPCYPLLYSRRGYKYCDLLLSQGQAADVLRRATQSMEIARHNNWLLAIGLDHLSLGRATGDSSHLDQAVVYIRRAGTLDYLPLALLARATPADLEEVHTLATRCGMRLHLCDYHLAQARRDAANRQHHIDEAARLIEETGYHRRDAELAELRRLP